MLKKTKELPKNERQTELLTKFVKESSNLKKTYQINVQKLKKIIYREKKNINNFSLKDESKAKKKIKNLPIPNQKTSHYRS